MSGQTQKNKQQRSRVKTNQYISGNTVRKYEENLREPITRERSRVEERERRRRQTVTKRNQEKARQMGLGQILYLVTVLTFACLVCFSYIELQSGILSKMKQVTQLESQVADLKADNEAALKRINTTNDLESMKNTAINELQMKYASAEQIVFYTVSSADYMNQYSNIPKD